MALIYKSLLLLGLISLVPTQRLISPLFTVSDVITLKGHCNQIYQVYFSDEKHRVLFIQHY